MFRVSVHVKSRILESAVLCSCLTCVRVRGPTSDIRGPTSDIRRLAWSSGSNIDSPEATWYVESLLGDGNRKLEADDEKVSPKSSAQDMIHPEISFPSHITIPGSSGKNIKNKGIQKSEISLQILLVKHRAGT